MRHFTIFLLGGIAIMTIACRTNESPEMQVDDAQITAQIKSKLASDVGLSTVTNISVNSANGIVTLAGQVDTNEAKAKAEAVAKSVPKVIRIIDNLQVVSSVGQGSDKKPRSAVYIHRVLPGNYCSATPRRT
jgi:hypothetical protein